MGTATGKPKSSVKILSLCYFDHHKSYTPCNGFCTTNYKDGFKIQPIIFKTQGQLLLALPIGSLNLLKPTGHVMHQQFNIQQLYVLPTLYLSENKQRLVPLTA